MSATQKQYIPRAIEFALNETAYKTSMTMRAELGKYVDRPNPYTLKVLQYKKADARKGVFESKVGFVSPTFIPARPPPGTFPANYMHYLWKGGTRAPKKQYIPVPTKKLKLNKYGNMPRFKIKNLLGNKNYFQAEFNGKPGIFKRNRRNPPDMVIGYEKSAQYSPQYPFAGEAQKNFRKYYAKSFDKFLGEVLTRKGLNYKSRYKILEAKGY